MLATEAWEPTSYLDNLAVDLDSFFGWQRRSLFLLILIFLGGKQPFEK
jgi:hypothetical protein